MNDLNQPQGGDILLYIVVIAALGVGSYVIRNSTTLNDTVKDTKKDTVNDTKKDTRKDTRKPNTKEKISGVCSLDCSSIPGSSCVNGKCTDPYLYLQRF